MGSFDFRPVPKPEHKRAKRKQGQETAITAKVDKEIYRRASEEGYTVCEHCGCSVPRFRFERCHMLNASQYGTGRAPGTWLSCVVPVMTTGVAIIGQMRPLKGETGRHGSKQSFTFTTRLEKVSNIGNKGMHCVRRMSYGNPSDNNRTTRGRP